MNIIPLKSQLFLNSDLKNLLLIKNIFKLINSEFPRNYNKSRLGFQITKIYKKIIYKFVIIIINIKII